MHSNSKSSTRFTSQGSREDPRGMVQKRLKMCTKLKKGGAEDVWISALIGLYDEMPMVARFVSTKTVLSEFRLMYKDKFSWYPNQLLQMGQRQKD